MDPEEFKRALALEAQKFETAYRWLEEHMPPSFLEEVDPETRILVARSLLSLPLQNYNSTLHFRHFALVLCLDAPDADLKILKCFGQYGIRYYRAFVSNAPPPDGKNTYLRIALLYFTEAAPSDTAQPPERREELIAVLQETHPQISESERSILLQGIDHRFLRSMTGERLKLALKVFARARTSDLCQYEIRKNATEAPSLQLVLAWRNAPKHNFLARLASLFFRHHLALQKVVAAYIDPYSTESTLILSVGLHGLEGKQAWEEANLEDLLKEICLLKFFDTSDSIQTTFVKGHLLTGHQAHAVRAFAAFAHQALVHADPYLYSFENVLEGLLRHPELTCRLVQAFEQKFHPKQHDLASFEKSRKELLEEVDKLDTGQASHDMRRKEILRQVMNFIQHTQKCNFFLDNKSAFSFRLDPAYLDHLPFKRQEKFPDLPFGIFFFYGSRFIGFNIRFKDLSRGGVRTVFPERREVWISERNTIFTESYNLAYTQQKKNKDIPEGGGKTALLLEPFEEVYAQEIEIYKLELESANVETALIEEKLKAYRNDHRLNYLYSAQKSFTESFLTLINCEESGELKQKEIVDYYKKPEYIYLGPDENMHNVMIDWIAQCSATAGYRVGLSFMTSKPTGGINHKQYGVTSHGVNIYMREALLHLGIDPSSQSFTVKISGGPDGDVAGNQILNLYKYYPKTAKLLALTDVSGTIFDPEGLDLSEMKRLFDESLPIRNYPPEKLHAGGFLLDLKTKREETAYAMQTLIHRNVGGSLKQEWLSGNDMNFLYRHNVHQVKCDVFIPGGGRPRTLNDANYHDYLDEGGKPSSKAIVEGANLYLTPGARLELEKLGVLIFKDSSCNKGGVISSSLEVLAGLTLTLEEFVQHKETFIRQTLDFIAEAASLEAKILLKLSDQTHIPLSELSDQVSERINRFKYLLLDYLVKEKTLSKPLEACLLRYCPPLLRTQYADRVLNIPEIHKRAIIACFLASRVVYTRGLAGDLDICQALPQIIQDPAIVG